MHAADVPTPVTVAILAGGRGRRLGGETPKALIRIGDRTLLERAVERARAATDEVLVVAPARLGLAHPGARAVEDVLPDTGPLSALVASLEAASRDIVVALGVDLPLVSPDLLRRLASILAAQPGRVDAVVPQYRGHAHPLAAAYRRRLAPRLRALLESGRRSLIGAIEDLSVTWLDDAAVESLPGGGDALLNVNTPEDLELARSRLAPAGEPARPAHGRRGRA